MIPLGRVFCVASLLIAHAALAQEPARTVDPDIVVTGETAKERIAKAVQQLTGEGFGQIPRWNHPLCVAIRGASADYAGELHAAISAAATDAGLRILDGQCNAEVEIDIAGQADALAQSFIKRQPGLLRDLRRVGMPSQQQRRQWLQPAPVRWVTGTGSQYQLQFRGRLQQSVREDKVVMVVIVDPALCAGVTRAQLSAYLTMVVLAAPPHGSSGVAGSITTLFDRNHPEIKPPGLTSLDHSILRALYRTNGRMTDTQQRMLMRAYVRRDQARTE